MDSFSYLEPVFCSMSSSNCWFLNCIQVSQEAGQVVWYSHLFQSFPQFIVIHTVKGFGIVNKAEVDVFLEFSCFFADPADVCNLISGSSVFSKTNLKIWKFSAPGLSTCLMHPTWAGDLFHPRWYTCFDAVLLKHPTLAFSHRVQKSVLYICVSPLLIHVNVWQKPLQYCKVISLQLINK